MSHTTFYMPRSAEEAAELIHQNGADLILMSGGTIVMQRVNEGALIPRQLMSLKLAGLDGVRHGLNAHGRADGPVEIGATTTLATVAQIEALPPLAAAARSLGGPALRTMASIGGNLFARAPYGDLGVALLALDAEVELVGGRRLSLEEFYRARSSGELVTAVRVGRPQGGTAYLKLGRREANSPSVVAVAVHVIRGADGVCSDIRIVLGAAGPHALRARRAEEQLRGRPLDGEAGAAAAAVAMEECEPFTDALASEWYRRKMVGVYVQRALEAARLATDDRSTAK